MKTLVLSLFPGCGARFVSENLNGMGYKIQNLMGNKGIVEPDFDFHMIEWNLGGFDFIFVDWNKQLFRILQKNGIRFAVVMPDCQEGLSEHDFELIRNQWVGRVASSIQSLDELKKFRDEFQENCKEIAVRVYKPVQVFKLKENEFLSDILPAIYHNKETFTRFVSNNLSDETLSMSTFK